MPDKSEGIQLILKKEQVEQIIDSLEKTGQIDLATKMAGLMPKKQKPEMEFPFELESGKKAGICEAKGCMVHVSGKAREESLKSYGHVFCGKEGEGHIGDIKKAEAKKEDKGPIIKLPKSDEITAKPELEYKKVVQKTLASKQETTEKPAPKIVEKHLPTRDELPDKCEKCGMPVPANIKGFIYGKTGHVYCEKHCKEMGYEL